MLTFIQREKRERKAKEARERQRDREREKEREIGDYNEFFWCNFDPIKVTRWLHGHIIDHLIPHIRFHAFH